MTQAPIRQDQAQKIKELLTKLNLWSRKEETVKEFSASNFTHISELTHIEAHNLLNYLNELVPRCDNMRKTLLSLGYQLHWDLPRSPAEVLMEGKRINYNRVNEWSKSNVSKYKKSFTKLNPTELNETVKQLKLIVESEKAKAHGEKSKQK
jgi:DNA-directed RNA polymerase subunit F